MIDKLYSRINKLIILFYYQYKAQAVNCLCVEDKLDDGGCIELFDIDKTKEKKLVGTLTYESCCYEPDKVELKFIKVKEPYLRKKYGTKMMKRFIRWAINKDFKKIYLYAVANGDIDQKSLIEFYKRFGFTTKDNYYMELIL